MPLDADDLKTVENYKKAIKQDVTRITANGVTKIWVYKDVQLPTAGGAKLTVAALLSLVDNNAVKTVLKKSPMWQGFCRLEGAEIAFEGPAGAIPYKMLKTAVPLLLGKKVHEPAEEETQETEGDEDAFQSKGPGLGDAATKNPSKLSVPQKIAAALNPKKAGTIPTAKPPPAKLPPAIKATYDEMVLHLEELQTKLDDEDWEERKHHAEQLEAKTKKFAGSNLEQLKNPKIKKAASDIANELHSYFGGGVGRFYDAGETLSTLSDRLGIIAEELDFDPPKDIQIAREALVPKKPTVAPQKKAETAAPSDIKVKQTIGTALFRMEVGINQLEVLMNKYDTIVETKKVKDSPRFEQVRKVNHLPQRAARKQWVDNISKGCDDIAGITTTSPIPALIIKIRTGVGDLVKEDGKATSTVAKQAITNLRSVCEQYYNTQWQKP